MTIIIYIFIRVWLNCKDTSCRKCHSMNKKRTHFLWTLPRKGDDKWGMNLHDISIFMLRIMHIHHCDLIVESAVPWTKIELTSYECSPTRQEHFLSTLPSKGDDKWGMNMHDISIFMSRIMHIHNPYCECTWFVHIYDKHHSFICSGIIKSF